MFTTGKTQGTILASYDLNGPDKIFICQTLDFGKIEAIGRGVKKPSSRLRPHLESFAVSDLLLILGAKNSIIRSCFTLENFLNLRSNLALYFAASYLLELADRLTVSHDPEPRIFSLLVGSLRKLNGAKRQSEIDFNVASFQFKILDILGYRPRFDVCACCHAPAPAGNIFFSLRHGGVLCGKCRRQDNQTLRIGGDLAEGVRVLTDAASGPTEISGKIPLNDLQKIGSMLITYQLGKKMKSERFVGLKY